MMSVLFLFTMFSTSLCLIDAMNCRDQMIVKFCLPAGYTEILRLDVSSCSSYVRIQVLPMVTVLHGRVTVYASNKSKIVNVLDTSRQDINVRIPRMYKCMMKCTNKDQLFWIESGFLQTHMSDGLLGKGFFLEGICYRSRRVFISGTYTYIRITLTFTDGLKKKLKEDRCTVPSYSKPSGFIRGKHSKIVRVSPADSNNHFMAKTIKTHNAKGNSNKQTSEDAYLETITPNTGFVRKKRNHDCAEDSDCPQLVTFKTKPPPDIITNQQLTNSTSLTSSTEDVANLVTTRSGSSTEQSLGPKSVNNGNQTQFTPDFTHISPTANSFSQISTEKIITAERELTLSTSSGIVENDTLEIYSSSTTAKPLTQSESVSTLTPPTTFTTNIQSNSGSTTEDVAYQESIRTWSSTEQALETKYTNDENKTESTIELTLTSSTILHIEATSQTDNKTDKTASILSTTRLKIPTMPDSGTVPTTSVDAVGVFMVALSTVLCLF